jgi:hypothetical protein
MAQRQSSPRLLICKPRNSQRQFSLCLTVLALTFTVVRAEVRCVRAGATGVGDGSDWDNAYPALPSSLVRGGTYYVADGSYRGCSLDAASGDIPVVLKKATDVEHGTDVGWQAGYGDGEAVFGELSIRADLMVLDGLVLDADVASSEPSALLDLSGESPVNDCTVKNCTLRMGRGSGAVRRGVTAYGGVGHTFTNVTVDGESKSPGPGAANWMFALSVGPHAVQNCTLINAVDLDAFRVFGTFTIQGCVISNFTNPNYAIGEHVDVIQSWGGGVTDGVFEQNRCENIRGQLGNFSSDGSGSYTRFEIRNNVFSKITSACFIGQPQMHWYNNVFYQVSSDIAPHPLMLYGIAGYSATGCIIRNNVFLECGSESSNPNEGMLGAIGFSLDNATISHNYYGGAGYAGKSLPPGADFINGGDPGFLDETNGVFRPRDGSVLIDAGLPIQSFSHDYSNVQRPQGAGWDIGAYESLTE